MAKITGTSENYLYNRFIIFKYRYFLKHKSLLWFLNSSLNEI